jgi:hypothetical protein
MDAVVIVDPVQYQRRRDERSGVSMPLRSMHFGPDGGGLVTFLVYPPNDLVLEVKFTARRLATLPLTRAALPNGRGMRCRSAAVTFCS